MVVLAPLERSDPAPLGRAAAVVGGRGDVLDGADLEADRTQRTDRGLTAGAGTLHEHVDLAHAVVHRAANGVDLREPWKPTVPADAHEMTAPVGSVIVTIVLLNVLLMCAWPAATFFFSLRRTFFAPAAVRLLGGIGQLLLGWSKVIRVITSSSCRRSPYDDPYGCGRWSACADHAPAGRCGAGDPGTTRSRSCGGCPRSPHDGGHLRSCSWLRSSPGASPAPRRPARGRACHRRSRWLRASA